MIFIILSVAAVAVIGGIAPVDVLDKNAISGMHF
jgi:hypothetical protein